MGGGVNNPKLFFKEFFSRHKPNSEIFPPVVFTNVYQEFWYSSIADLCSLSGADITFA